MHQVFLVSSSSFARQNRTRKEGRKVICDYCQRPITKEEIERERFISIREFKYGKKREMKYINGGLSMVIHRDCLRPGYSEEHPCIRGLVE